MKHDIAISRFLEGSCDVDEVVELTKSGICTTKDLWVLAKMTKEVHEEVRRKEDTQDL